MSRKIKARVFTTQAQIQREAKQALIQDMSMHDYSKDIAYQAFAVCFAVLAKNYGFGKKRLHSLKDEIEMEFDLMEKGIFGKPYSTNDVVKMLKTKYDIDFEKSIYKE